jgi:signal transduction histidine kinase
VTDARLSEECIQRQNRELQGLNATKNRLLRIIAHDLKNQFGVILGFTDVLGGSAGGRDADEILRDIGVVNEVAHASYNLLINLLD